MRCLWAVVPDMQLWQEFWVQTMISVILGCKAPHTWRCKRHEHLQVPAARAGGPGLLDASSSGVHCQVHMPRRGCDT